MGLIKEITRRFRKQQNDIAESGRVRAPDVSSDRSSYSGHFLNSSNELGRRGNNDELSAKEDLQRRIDHAILSIPGIKATVVYYDDNMAPRHPDWFKLMQSEREFNSSKSNHLFPKTDVKRAESYSISEERDFIESLYHDVLATGSISCWGKLTVRGQQLEYSDYGPVFAAGTVLKTQNESTIRAFARARSLLPSAIYGLVVTSQSDILDPEHKDALIVSYTGTPKTLDSNDFSRAQPTVVDVPQLHEFIQTDEKGQISIITHSFSSRTMQRGHPLPIQITYAVPTSLGEEIEKRIKINPWVIDALTQVVIENAKEELEHPTVEPIFEFLSLNGTKENTGMFGYSNTERMAAHIRLRESQASEKRT